MGLGLDVAMPRAGGGLPVFEITGDDDVAVALLRHVHLDVEMPADDDGNPFLRVVIPDRQFVVIRSSILPGDLFFRLEEILAGTPARPALRLKADGKAEDLTPQMGWCLLDFSGAWVRALRLAAAADPAGAAAAAAEAVRANPHDAGFRVVWGRYLAAAGRDEEARGAFEEELGLFPSSYRAMAELAVVDLRAGKAAQALEHLTAGLAIYPNHLRSLLLMADLLLAGGGDAAVPYLARAWRLAGALTPQHVIAVLERRKRQDLLDEVRVGARTADLAGTQLAPPEAAAAPPSSPSTSSSSPSSVAEPVVPMVDASVEMPEPAQAPERSEAGEGTVPSATADDIIRLTAKEIFRDGAVSAEEKVVFRSVCAKFPIPADRVKSIVDEEKAASARRGPSGGDLDPRSLFRETLRLVYADGRVSRSEATLVVELARILGLSRDECAAIQREVAGS